MSEVTSGVHTNCDYPRRFEMQVNFKTALITGSSRGFGRQIAVKLAMEEVKKIAIH